MKSLVALLVAVCVLPIFSGCLGPSPEPSPAATSPLAIANEDLDMRASACQEYSWQQTGLRNLEWKATTRTATTASIYVLDRNEANHACEGESFDYYSTLSAKRLVRGTGSGSLRAGSYAIVILCDDAKPCSLSFSATLS